MSAAQVLIALRPDSADATAFRTALARFGDRIALAFAAGPELAGALPDAEIVVAQGLSDDELAQAQRLRSLSSWAAGVERAARPALLSRGIVLTNASGVHGPNIAEHLLAMILMFTRAMPRLYRAQLARRWRRSSASDRKST